MRLVLAYALLAIVAAGVIWCFVDAWRIVNRDTSEACGGSFTEPNHPPAVKAVATQPDPQPEQCGGSGEGRS